MKILFISRAYPPVVGGIENQNFELGKWLSKIAEVKIIANTHGRKFLPIFTPYATIKTLFLLHNYDVILLGDGILAITGWVIKLFSKKKVVSVLHGLDINYNSSSLGVWYEKILVSIYQNLWTKYFLPKLDAYIAVGNETIRVGISHGLNEQKFVFIPNGVDIEKHLTKNTKRDLEKIIKIDTTNKNILLTAGRLAKRKGVAWFIKNVLPNLKENFIYIISGDGPDKKNILKAIEETKYQNKIIMLGYIDDQQRNILLNTADLFVQPNIKIVGDMEGFGISVIEAGSCRLPVLASNIEGLKDAIKDGKNGFLVGSENSSAYVDKINELFSQGSPRDLYGESVRKFVIENYSWEKIAKEYLSTIKNIINKKK